MTAISAVFTAVLAVTCGGTANASGYGWADPISSGCSNDAYTARSSALLDNDEHIGTIELRYRPTCRTVWARVYSQGPELWAQVKRKQDSATTFRENAQWSATKGQYHCYTAMLNDAGYLSYAEGYATASGRYGWDQTITGSY
ncbi:DUF2690 domain-containing protein [Streptomyces sp. NPDC056194]|uniref:DUF2690 domain-containing protein n=1 Tax=unclassified Streptomyces TaxID=2593676 RepID=UPI0035E20A08